MAEANNVNTYNSLLAIEVRRKELQKQLDECGMNIKEQWGKLTSREESAPQSKTQRLLEFATNSVGLIDGAILGYKLYRRFSQFRKK